MVKHSNNSSTICRRIVRVFDHFMGLALKGLIFQGKNEAYCNLQWLQYDFKEASQRENAIFCALLTKSCLQPDMSYKFSRLSLIETL